MDDQARYLDEYFRAYEALGARSPPLRHQPNRQADLLLDNQLQHQQLHPGRMTSHQCANEVPLRSNSRHTMTRASEGAPVHGHFLELSARGDLNGVPPQATDVGLFSQSGLRDLDETPEAYDHTNRRDDERQTALPRRPFTRTSVSPDSELLARHARQIREAHVAASQALGHPRAHRLSEGGGSEAKRAAVAFRPMEQQHHLASATRSFFAPPIGSATAEQEHDYRSALQGSFTPRGTQHPSIPDVYSPPNTAASPGTNRPLGELEAFLSNYQPGQYPGPTSPSLPDATDPIFNRPTAQHDRFNEQLQHFGYPNWGTDGPPPPPPSYRQPAAHTREGSNERPEHRHLVDILSPEDTSNDQDDGSHRAAPARRLHSRNSRPTLHLPSGLASSRPGSHSPRWHTDNDELEPLSNTSSPPHLRPSDQSNGQEHPGDGRLHLHLADSRIYRVEERVRQRVFQEARASPADEELEQQLSEYRHSTARIEAQRQNTESDEAYRQASGFRGLLRRFPHGPHPASFLQLAMLRTRLITKADLEHNVIPVMATTANIVDPTSPYSEPSCEICIEVLPIGTEVTVMPCRAQHFYHNECVGQWLYKNDTCPKCRHRLGTRVE